MRKLKDVLHEHQLKIHRGLLIGFAVLWTARVFTSLLPTEAGIALTFAGLAYVLYDISQDTYSPHGSKFYKQQVELYAELLSLIEEMTVQKAILIQYSGVTVSALIAKLLSKGAEVDLYVVNPVSAIGVQQTKRIKDKIANLPDELASHKNGRLKVYYYDTPASVGGALIDNQMLAIGWYTYQRQVSTMFPKDNLRVLGSDQPGMLVDRKADEFEMLARVFQEFVNDYHDCNRDKKRERTPELELRDGKPVKH